LIIDTDVIIWYLRGEPDAKDFVEANIPFSVSSVTYMELTQGMKDKAEFRKFQKKFKSWKTEIIHIDQEISSRAVFYVQEYALSHTMKLADALIAATAVQSSETLATANEKHYRFIPNVELKKFMPRKVEEEKRT
jgi:predicted nucleic acid-binding protein